MGQRRNDGDSVQTEMIISHQGSLVARLRREFYWTLVVYPGLSAVRMNGESK